MKRSILPLLAILALSAFSGPLALAQEAEEVPADQPECESTGYMHAWTEFKRAACHEYKMGLMEMAQVASESFLCSLTEDDRASYSSGYKNGHDDAHATPSNELCDAPMDEEEDESAIVNPADRVPSERHDQPKSVPAPAKSGATKSS